MTTITMGSLLAGRGGQRLLTTSSHAYLNSVSRIASRCLHGGRLLAVSSPVDAVPSQPPQSASSSSSSSSSSSPFPRWPLLAALAAAAASAALFSRNEANAKSAAKVAAAPVQRQQEEQPAPEADGVDEDSLQQRNAKAFAALRDLLGDRLTVDEDERERHGRDAYSYHSDRPPWAIAYPNSTAEVSSIARILSAARVPMIAYGSGTSLEGHTTAPSGGVVIDVSRMNAVKEVHEADMDVVVEPGITWNDLNDQLKQYGLFFPVDPGPGASIGGMCGTSCSGTNAVRYGTMRMNVLNLTVVLADGTVLKTAQRARKSSAGYNLTHFFIGTEGTLGIITEATLRLQNIPEHTAVAACSFPSVHHAAGAAIAVMRKGIRIGCVELLDEKAVEIVNGYVGLELDKRPTLFFKGTTHARTKFHGSEVGVKDEVQQVEALVKDFEAGPFDWASDKKRRDQIWEGRKGALWAVMAYKPDNQVWTTDVCVPISRLADTIQATKKEIEESGVLAPIVGHVGDGNVHVMMSINPNDEAEMRAAKKLNERMVERAIEAEGTCTGEHGVGVGKRDFLEHELGVSTVDTMRKLKRALDPHGLMNPGKVFRLKEEDSHTQNGHDGGLFSAVRGVVDGLKKDLHDLRPQHKAMSGPPGYVAAPSGKPEGEPPASKHDTTPPPERPNQDSP